MIPSPMVQDSHRTGPEWPPENILDAQGSSSSPGSSVAANNEIYTWWIRCCGDRRQILWTTISRYRWSQAKRPKCKSNQWSSMVGCLWRRWRWTPNLGFGTIYFRSGTREQSVISLPFPPPFHWAHCLRKFKIAQTRHCLEHLLVIRDRWDIR